MMYMLSNSHQAKFQNQSTKRRESPIHTILNPPDKQILNNNSSCMMKEAITNISQQLNKFELICRYTEMKIWKFDTKKMLSVELISKFNSSRNVSASNLILLPHVSLNNSCCRPYESLGKHSTEDGIELILPLFNDNEG